MVVSHPRPRPPNPSLNGSRYLELHGGLLTTCTASGTNSRDGREDLGQDSPSGEKKLDNSVIALSAGIEDEDDEGWVVVLC